MTDKTKNKRNAPIPYRPPVDLIKEFNLRVEQSGLSRNAFITQSIFEAEAPRATRRPVIEQKLVAHLLSQAVVLHGDLQEIACAAKEDRNIESLLQEAVAEIIAIRSACFKAMGHKP